MRNDGVPSENYGRSDLLVEKLLEAVLEREREDNDGERERSVQREASRIESVNVSFSENSRSNSLCPE